jgi:iron complex outermembrane receptor protein
MDEESRMRTLCARTLAASGLIISLALPLAAQEEAAPPAPEPAPAPAGGDTEEIVVTGSYIRGTPEDAALPVDVTSFDDLQEQGAPSVAELVRNLAYTSGNLAETNQFGAGGGGQAQEGVLTVNLRGLGSARTLVLINGRRIAPSDAVGSDLSVLPKSAIGRLEVLKDGAAALYGSDAIGGVANFITRENFEGIEISASEQFIRKSDGDHEVALIGGWGNDQLHLMAAFEWSHRSELRFRDRDWGLIPEPLNPQGGWSSIANPAQIFPVVPGVTFGTIAKPDPNCALLGGAQTGTLAAGGCRFQYTFFDNLTEEQDNYKAYVEANYEFSDTTKLHVEGLYGLMDMPNWKSSPSYPPQSLFGPDRFIPATHPGFVDMAAQNPTLFPAGTVGAFALVRAIGVQGRLPDGSPLSAKRRTEQWRFAARLTGEVFDSISWETAFTYAERERLLDGEDTRTERMAFALDGLGGEGCDPATGTPGVGPCQYFNPFSNSIQRSAINGVVNPQFNPAVANSKELFDWLITETSSVNTNKLFVWDGVLSGQLPWFELPGGEIGWAFGTQVRREVYDLQLADSVNLAVEPCAFSNPVSVTRGNITQANFDLCQNGIANVTGPFSFLSGTREQYFKRVVWGLFGEISLPIHEMFDAQLAVRYEDYGGRVGSTVDPKLSLRLQPFEWVTLRGSVSTTFRGPPQSFLANRITTLQFIPPTNAFKAVDVVGNPNLKPESALTSNVGVVFEWEGLYASLDYWRFNFKDPFQTESAGQIVAAYTTIGGTGAAVPAGHPAGCQTTPNAAGFVGWGVDPANPNADPVRCAGMRSHIGFAPDASGNRPDNPANLVLVDTNIINGSRIRTSGLDFYLQYELELLGGTLAIGSAGSYRLDYTSKDFVDIAGFLLASGGDFNGFLNDNASPFQPLPELKTDTFLKFNRGTHTAQIIGHYVTSYVDQLPPRNTITGQLLDKVDNFFTVDMHYVVRLFEETTALSFSILNVADKDPPLAGTDLNYDPFTHDGRGRMFKVGLTYTWQPQ